MTYNVLMGTLNPTHSLTHSLTHYFVVPFNNCVYVPCSVWILDFSQIFSLRFNGHFPSEPGLAGVCWSKGWRRWWWQLDYWSYKSCHAPVKSNQQQTNIQFFSQFLSRASPVINYLPVFLPVAYHSVSWITCCYQSSLPCKFHAYLSFVV